MDIAEIVQELNRRFALPLKEYYERILSSGMTQRESLPRNLISCSWILKLPAAVSGLTLYPCGWMRQKSRMSFLIGSF